MITKMRITIFCSSSDSIDPVYFRTTTNLIKSFVNYDCEVITGGGKSGLMQTISDVCIKENIKITGIITKDLINLEMSNICNYKRIVVNSFNERKNQMIEVADMIIVLPGGIGTLSESFHFLEVSRFNNRNVSILFLNTNGFFDGFIEYLEDLVDKKFIEKAYLNKIKIKNSILEILEILDEIKKL